VKEAGVKTVIVTGRAAGLQQQITAGRHTVVGDEPASAGGGDTGLSPYDFLLSALGSCTSMTLALYARRKSWPLEAVTVRLRYSRNHVEDCATCETQDVRLDRIDRELELVGSLSQEQRARLLEIANKCPVHQTLSAGAVISTRLA
jgi:putative redox protein